MHTKTFTQKQSEGKNLVQIRCYFAYNKSSLKTKEEWSLFLNNMLGEYLEGPPTFIEMVPSLKA